MNATASLDKPDAPLIAASVVALGAILPISILTFWLWEGPVGNLINASIYALAAVWLGKLAVRGGPSRFHPVLIPLAFPLAIALAQLRFGSTVTPWLTDRAAIRWGACLAVAFVSLQVSASPDALRLLRQILVYFGFALAVVSTLQLFTSPGKIFWVFDSTYEDMVMGPFVSRDRYSAFMELVLPMALFEAFGVDRLALSYTAMAATMMASVIAGASRAGSILIVAESVVVVLLLARKSVAGRRRLFRLSGWLTAFALVFIGIVGWSNLLDRFHETIGFRGEMLSSAISMARQRPLTGFGLGSFETVYPAYAKFEIGLIVNHAHDDWAEWAAEGGLPMVAGMVLVAIVAVIGGFRNPWALGPACVAVHGLADFPLQEQPLLLWTCALLGAMLVRAPRIRRNGSAAGLTRRQATPAILAGKT